MLSTLHEFYITPDHYHNDAIKDIRSLQRCFLLHQVLPQISCQEKGYHLPSSSISCAWAPSTNECVCMSEGTVCKSLRWVMERGVDSVCGCGMCVINLYKRGNIVSATMLSDLASLNACYYHISSAKKRSPFFFFLFFFISSDKLYFSSCCGSKHC